MAVMLWLVVAAVAAGCDDAGGPVADVPAADAQVVDTPVVDVPGTDVPVVDVPVADLPVVDAPAADPGTPDPGPTDEGLPPATLGRVSPADLQAELAGRDFLLINVHVPYAGQIPGTDRHLIWQDVDAIVAYLGADLARKAVVYCLSNAMSTSAGNALVSRGYRGIRYLDGGMAAWKSAGYPFEP